MQALALLFNTFGALLRWTGNLSIILAIAYSIYFQLINSVAVATITIAALCSLLFCIHWASSTLQNIANATAAIHIRH